MDCGHALIDAAQNGFNKVSLGPVRILYGFNKVSLGHALTDAAHIG